MESEIEFELFSDGGKDGVLRYEQTKEKVSKDGYKFPKSVLYLTPFATENAPEKITVTISIKV